ncbi:MAG: type II toxin-antitoxin system RelE/ParE family toxin [Planctomycetaceae bacterium]
MGASQSRFHQAIGAVELPTYSIILLDEARRDFEESLAWYEEKSFSAALRFRQSLEDTFQRISHSPQQFSLLDRIHRDCPLKHFPFRVVFRVTATEIVVVAIAHASRRPDFWGRRD